MMNGQFGSHDYENVAGCSSWGPYLPQYGTYSCEGDIYNGNGNNYNMPEQYLQAQSYPPPGCDSSSQFSTPMNSSTYYASHSQYQNIQPLVPPPNYGSNGYTTSYNHHIDTCNSVIESNYQGSYSNSNSVYSYFGFGDNNKKCDTVGTNNITISTEINPKPSSLKTRYNRERERNRSSYRESGYRSVSRHSTERDGRRDRREYSVRNRYPYERKSRSRSPRGTHTKNLKYVSSKDKRRDYSSTDSKRTRSDRDYSQSRSRYSSHVNREKTQENKDCDGKQKEATELSVQEIIDSEKKVWTRTTPAELYYKREGNVMIGSEKLQMICEEFSEKLVKRADKVRASKPPYSPPPRKNRARPCKANVGSDSSSESAEELCTDEEDCSMEELTLKQQHPDRLHPEMWYNDPGEMNDGPLCRCSVKSRKSGIRHGIYAGEEFIEPCNKNSNNSDRLFHYRITIAPPTNFLTKTPTLIKYDGHEFIFEGFSMFSHCPLIKLPTCKVIRFNIEYTILYIDEKIPENFTVCELDLFYEYLFRELLELVDLDFYFSDPQLGCSRYHFMPRFVRDIPDNGKEILSMKEVLQFLMSSSTPLIEESQLKTMYEMSQYEWQSFADEVKGMVVAYPGKKPCCVRVDQLDRNIDIQKPDKLLFPEIVHFGIRPPQLSYAGNPDYQKAWRDYVKFRHLLANMSKPTYEDKRKLEAKENKLQEMRSQSKMKRDVTIAVSAEGFFRTGIMCDVIQHAMLLPVLASHLRFHNSLNVLEKEIGYSFKNRALLQLALTHPSYRENFGTNPDHARNSLTNCGIRQPEYGDRRIHYLYTRKRGINTLINIMSRFGKKEETESNINHNERLEFLGDAVVEFLSSIHLFQMFPDLEEGGLATYRAAIVQNQHLAVLARTLKLDQYMLYAHGSDLCHDLELRHAMANCFEALMGALFLDGGILVADKVFGETLFKEHNNLVDIWFNCPPHPLQEQEPDGDRKWIENFPMLQKLTEFEKSTGIEFRHIRLLARAFTDRSIGYTNLTLGSNQRLEFLGDTVLQLIASEYLYKYFPEHHEGHLSLLRSSLVNNRTQAVVCDDLGMASYAIYSNPKAELKTKDRADLLEALIGAIYVDQGSFTQGLDVCKIFCEVTLFPRLQNFIMNQDWNDPKSKLQQCCLTLRTMDGGEPDIPVYKVIECKGPTNTRIYTVAVYFRGNRLAEATGHSIQQAEMNSAKRALELSQNLFPQLNHQKRVIAKSMKKQKCKKFNFHRETLASLKADYARFCSASNSNASKSDRVDIRGRNDISSSASKDNASSSSASKDNASSSSTSKDNAISSSASKDTAISTSASKDTPISTSASKDTAISSSASKDTAISGSASKDTAISSRASKDTAISSSASKDTAISSSASKDTAISGSTSKDTAISSSASKNTAISGSTSKDTAISSRASKDAAISSSASKDTAISTSTSEDNVISSSASKDNSTSDSANKDDNIVLTDDSQDSIL